MANWSISLPRCTPTFSCSLLLDFLEKSTVPWKPPPPPSRIGRKRVSRIGTIISRPVIARPITTLSMLIRAIGIMVIAFLERGSKRDLRGLCWNRSSPDWFFFLRFFFLFMEFRINEKKRGGKTFPFFHSMEPRKCFESKKRFFPSLLTGGENLVRVHSLWDES